MIFRRCFGSLTLAGNRRRRLVLRQTALTGLLLLAIRPYVRCPFTPPTSDADEVASRRTGATDKPKSHLSAAAPIMQRETRGTARTLAQIDGFGPGSRGGPGRGRRGNRPTPSRDSFPSWDINPDFSHDVFTFARIQFDSIGPFGWHDRWDNDYPDADWNFSLRLQQLTSLQGHPNGRVVQLTDPGLLDCPFVYMAGVQYLQLSESESEAFAHYLNNGGFFMMDDLWGEDSLRNVLEQMQRVFPNKSPVELSLDHEVFHLIYDLKELPQVTDYLTWSRGYDFEFSHEGSTGDTRPHFLAYYDDQGRMVGIVCHNNDLGDGWEREGEHAEYFEKFSLKHSYPFGINLISYVLTH